MFAGAWGGNLNKHETTHLQPGENEWFLNFVYTNALLAPLQMHFRLFQKLYNPKRTFYQTLLSDFT